MKYSGIAKSHLAARVFRRVVIRVLLLFGLASGQAAPPGNASGVPFREGRILVKVNTGANLARLEAFHRANSNAVMRTYPAIGNLQVLRLPPATSVAAALDRYRRSGLVEYAEPDYILHGFLTPNDPKFLSQWALNNVGQSSGTPGADIHALSGWDVQTAASGVVVAVIDSGIRYTHEDLAANMWVNPGEIAGNGIDDDLDGYVDDIHGISAINETGDPNDDYGHGTSVAGVLGAVGNNGKGITGVAWNVQLMACQFLDSQLDGVVSDAIECIDYARTKGARIINASWGMPSYNTQALYDAINSTRSAGMLFVAACGNSANNNDTTNSIYPASFNLDNIIAVAATTYSDELATWSSYGPSTVDLAAPGLAVLSCAWDNDAAYIADSGTSLAAPHVAGACALLWARFPNETYLQIKNRLLNGTDPLPALAGKCVTGGRLNLRKVLDPTVVSNPLLTARGYTNGQFQLRLTGGPSLPFVILSSSNLLNWVPVYTNQTSAGGILDFTDPAAGRPRKFYRARSGS